MQGRKIMKESNGDKKRTVWFVVLIAVFCGVFFLSFMWGQYSISPGEIFRMIGEKITGTDSGVAATKEKVFFNIRLPRVLGACIVGGGLAVSGCVYQGTMRNPMVSPDILGATSGAGMGAALALLMSWSAAAVQLIAFVFGLLAVALTYYFAHIISRKAGMVLSLVLTGIVMSALFEAGISLMKYVADPYSKLPAITFWLMGSLAAVVPSSLPLLVIPLVIGLIPLILMKWRINLLSLPDEEALSMGINITRMRIIVIVCATLITSSIVAVGGLIGWVGLIIPHMARITAGPDFRKLLPASLLMGSTFLLLVDDIARGATSMEIPLGILTAAVGAPFFLILMYRSQR